MGDQPVFDPDILDRLEEIFQDHGPDNPITSSEIAEECFPGDGMANPETRKAIRVLTEERGVPIVSGSTGYYMAETRVQIEEYHRKLNSRIAGIQQRKDLVSRAWEEHERRTGPSNIEGSQ